MLIQLLAAFGDNPLQFAGFLARERTSGAVEDGVAFLAGDQLEATDVAGSPLQVRGRESLQILDDGNKLMGMVGLKGLEPLRPLERQNLNLLRLPIPPQPLGPSLSDMPTPSTIPRSRLSLVCDLSG